MSTKDLSENRPAGLASRQVLDPPTNALKPTGSTVVDNDDDDLTSPSSEGNSVVVSRKDLGTHVSTKEELLDPLPHRSGRLAEDGKPEVLAGDSEPSFDELSPDITLSSGTFGERQRAPVSPPPGLLARQDDNLIQGELFEEALNKRLSSLSPNAPVRKFLFRVILTLARDCTTPALQTACLNLISRTAYLMKLLRENDKTSSSLGASYSWPSGNVDDMREASSGNVDDMTEASREIPRYRNGEMFLLVSSVTAIVLIIIVSLRLINIWSRLSEAKDRPFLDRGKKPRPDPELPRTPLLLMDNKALWLRDRCCIEDDIQRNDVVDKLLDEESNAAFAQKICHRVERAVLI
ncbi:UNVERIFIED_CONTAM: hypothetical protein K2H54_024315 [Gekko kuhli]